MSNDEERLLRERKPTGDNNAELLTLMENSRAARKAWLAEAKHDATTVMRRYRRFIDMNDAVSNTLFLGFPSGHTGDCSVNDQQTM